MGSKKNDFIVGIVITISIFILVFGIIYLKEYNIGEKTRTIQALFKDIGTLTVGDPVKINGVKMGKVTKRKIRENMVLVEMEIDASIFIPKDSKITIQNVGLMGERMIGIRLGKSKEPIDPDIPMEGRFDSGIAEAMGMLGVVFNDAKELVLIIKQLVNETVANEEFLALFSRVTNRLERLTAMADRMVVGNEEKLNVIIQDIQTTTAELKTLMDSNKDRINNIVTNFSNASIKVDSVLVKVDNIALTADDLVKRINSNETSIGLMLNDKDLYQELKSTAKEADSLLKTINKTGKIKVDVDLF